MSDVTTKQKPHKWNRRKDATHCIECEQRFKPGDDVYTDCAVNLHVGCLGRYYKTMKKLGLRKAVPHGE